MEASLNSQPFIEFGRAEYEDVSREDFFYELSSIINWKKDTYETKVESLESERDYKQISPEDQIALLIQAKKVKSGSAS